MPVINALSASGQGTIIFNGHPSPYGANYYELGMWFRVVAPPPQVPADGMGVFGPVTTPSNIPYNDTPYMGFAALSNPEDYVVLSLTNGNTFGLTRVDLADPNSPSLSPVPITFEGIRGDGSHVSVTFTTPGNGATTFHSYQFGSAFASGLVSVDIQATRWAMDNLVFTVPEPGVGSLLAVGLLAFAARKRCHAKRPR
jgi:hypothetical protein